MTNFSTRNGFLKSNGGPEVIFEKNKGGFHFRGVRTRDGDFRVEKKKEDSKCFRPFHWVNSAIELQSWKNTHLGSGS